MNKELIKRKEKTYNVIVSLEFDNRITAKNKKEAIEIIKSSFKDDYNLDITNSEITINN